MPHRNLFSREQRLVLFSLSAVLTIGLAFVWALNVQEPSQAQNLNPGQIRKLVKRLPKHLPLKYEVKNHDKDTWARDFALEVTNTSKKPIYFLEFWLVMPEVISVNGRKVGFTLRYGRMEFVEFSTMAEPNDVPIKPGETYTFHISAEHRKGWEKHKLEENRAEPNVLELSFTQLNFGDGTGFNGSDAMAYPYARSAASKPCAAPKQVAEVVADTLQIPLNTQISDQDDSLQPAFFWKASTITDAPIDTPVDGPTVAADPDICCPGTSCSWRKNTFYSCACGTARTTQSVACSDPTGRCSIDEFIDTWCSFGVGCPEFRVGACCDQDADFDNDGKNAIHCGGDDCDDQDSGRYPGNSENSFGKCIDGKDNDCDDLPDCFDPGCWNTFACQCPPINCGEGQAPGPYPDCECQPISPIVIDVSGNGFNLTNGPGGVPFDFNRDGTADRISWTTSNSDDAWLSLDRNKNGIIDSGMELFGNLTPQPTPPAGKEKNGFLALAVYDKPAEGGNGDGQINQSDAIFSSLRLWQDTNHNGISEPGELHTLDELGLATIELEYKLSSKVDPSGNKFRYRAKVKDKRDAQLGRWAWDVFLVKAP